MHKHFHIICVTFCVCDCVMDELDELPRAGTANQQYKASLNFTVTFSKNGKKKCDHYIDTL